jgi:hypothetical protein
VGDIVLEDPVSVGDSANREAARDRLIGDGVTDWDLDSAIEVDQFPLPIPTVCLTGVLADCPCSSVCGWRLKGLGGGAAGAQEAEKRSFREPAEDAESERMRERDEDMVRTVTEVGGSNEDLPRAERLHPNGQLKSLRGTYVQTVV